MDAKYLQTNVNSALAEALSAMVAAQPSDSVEFVGKYLQQYVERQKRIVAEAERALQVNAAALAEEEEEKASAAIADNQRRETEMYSSKLSNYLEMFAGECATKQSAMESATEFVSDYFNVPACYVGVVRKTGDNECLHYFGANAAQKHVMGKKLPKPVEEGEEAPMRQGISFNAFKIPEVPEEEPVELEEGQEPPPPKPAPTMQPLVVDDVMRDPGIKFFGIPKIGSFAAVPVQYKTLDHDAAVNVGAAGEYSPNPLPQNVLFCIDTIGKYRELTEADVSGTKQVAEVLVSTWEALETAMFAKHCGFLGDYKAANAHVQTTTAGFGDAEAAALAAATAALPAEDCPESLKAWKETEASLKAWTDAIAASEKLSDSVVMLSNHLLPTVPCVAQLFYAVAVITGSPAVNCRDVCGDVTWEVIRTCVVTKLPAQLAAYTADQERTNASPDDSFAAVKAFCEANNLFDVSIYPSSLAICGTLATWLQKAVAARGAAIAYQAENNVQLEK